MTWILNEVLEPEYERCLNCSWPGPGWTLPPRRMVWGFHIDGVDVDSVAGYGRVDRINLELPNERGERFARGCASRRSFGVVGRPAVRPGKVRDNFAASGQQDRASGDLDGACWSRCIFRRERHRWPQRSDRETA